jgi:hypothetical protein
LFGLYRLRVHFGDELLDLLHVSQHFHAEPFAQNLLRNGAGGHAPDGFARAGPSATRPGANAELGEVGVVGVRRAKLGRHLGVGFGAGIFVFHPHADGRAEGFALERAGENLDGIRLLARADNLRLTGAAAVEIGLDVCFREFELRRTTIDHDADTATVRFSPGGDAEEVPEGIRHAPRLEAKRRRGQITGWPTTSRSRILCW